MQTNNNFLSFFDNNSNNEFIEILGIKLFTDDIIIICLIIFLYNEGVKDQFLFIALILLEILILKIIIIILIITVILLYHCL